MHQQDRTTIVSCKLRQFMSSAENADNVVVTEMRKTAKKILCSEFESEARKTNGGFAGALLDGVLSLGTLSKNPAINSIGNDALDESERRELKLKILKENLDSALGKIDALGVDEIATAMEQLSYGLNASIRYVCTGNRVVKRLKLEP